MVHVVGFGAIARLIAHTLRTQGVPVTFLVRPSRLKEVASDWQCRVVSNAAHGKDLSCSTGYQFESSVANKTDSNKQIPLLLVCTKAYDVCTVIRSLRHRLASSSLIVLLNNGLGVEEDLQSVFAADSARPPISCGLLAHGAYVVDNTTVCHAGRGSFYLSTGGDARSMHATESLAEMLHPLGAKFVALEEFRERQLEKLVVNACINPITAITGQRNGGVAQWHQLLDRLLDESLPALRAAFPAIRLDKRALRCTLNKVIEQTKDNTSSMLQDVQAGRQTEIDFINGAIIRIAQQFKLAVPVNVSLLELLKKRQTGSDVMLEFERLAGQHT